MDTDTNCPTLKHDVEKVRRAIVGRLGAVVRRTEPGVIPNPGRMMDDRDEINLLRAAAEVADLLDREAP